MLGFDDRKMTSRKADFLSGNRISTARWSNPLHVVALWCLFLGGYAVSAAEGGVEVCLPEEPFPVLEQVLRESIDRSWRMIEEGLRVEEAMGEAEAAAAGRLPTVSGNFRYLGRIEDRDDFDRTRTFYQPQAVLTARQPLYHWGALQAQRRLGELRTAMAENNQAEAYRLLALEIRAAFLELGIHRKSLELASHRLALAEADLGIARARFEREEITAEALRMQELVVEEFSLILERLEREREWGVRSFSRLSGFNPVGREWIPEKIPVLRGFGNGAEGAGRLFLPWKELSRARIQQATEQFSIESARQRPRLDLVAGVSQDQVAIAQRSDVDRVVYFAGLELTWNLFDGYETRGRRSAALARKRLETQRHRRLEADWQDQLDRLENSVHWTFREVALAEEQLELAAMNLSQREEDLTRGLVSETEVVAARVAHAERDLAANVRRADYLLASAEFISHAGLDPVMDRYLARSRLTHN